MASLLGKHKISIETGSLADGDSIAAYLTSAAGTLLTSTTVGATERLDSIDAASHLDSSAYATGVDYLSSMGVVDNAGNWVPFTLNAAGELPVAATINQAGDYEEDSAHTTGDVGLFQLAVRRDTRSAGSDTDGDYSSFNVNAVGELWVKDADVLAQLVTMDAVLDNMYTEQLDQGTTLDSILADTTAILADTANIDTNVAAILADTANIDTNVGSLLTELLAQGTTLDSILSDTTAILADTANIDTNVAAILADTATIDSNLASLTKLEDAVHSSGDAGIQALAVRKDTNGSDAAAGDYTSLLTDASGALKVSDVSNGALLQQQVSVGNTATLLPASALSARKSLLIQNAGSSSIWIGSATVTTSGATAGIEVPKGGFMELEMGPNVSVYGISGGTVNANVLEMA